MSKAKHTPGPWFFHRDELLHERHPHGSYTLIGNFEQDDTGNPWDVDEANARLIAAAPELLEAARPMQEWADHYACDDPAWDVKSTVEVQISIEQLRKVRAAIAKAEGRSND